VLISDLFEMEDLEARIVSGHVNRRTHPEFPELAIVNYSDKCQFEQAWTITTMTARGVIYDLNTGVVLARGLKKLFNYGQGDAQYDLDAPILGAFDKLDGSLGIRYTRPDGLTAIATRGSFDSEQARHATALVREWGWQPAAFANYTFLYEIIYPENRIVLDYGAKDDLVRLGAVNITTGEYSPGVMEKTAATTLREVLAIPPRKNAEGYVVWLDAQTAVKIKQEDYVALHRIISSLSRKEVWRQLRAGTFLEFATALPDEFHEWAKTTAEALCDQHVSVYTDAEGVFHLLEDQHLPGRKEQALWLKANARPQEMGFVFSMLDGRDITDAVWRAVEPHGASEIPTSELVMAGAAHD
jgi:RNA ligase